MSTQNILVSTALLLSAQLANSDTLRLKSGASLQGSLVNASAREIRFQTADGGTKVYGITDVDGIDFAPLPPPAPPEPAVASKVEQPRATPAIVVPAGTEITVRTIDNIQGSATGAGKRYHATVDDPIVVNNEVVIPRGANCTVEVVALQGGQEVDLRLYDVSIRGKSYATASEFAVVKAQGTSKGKKAVRRGIGLGAIGAGIGAMAGGGEGAAIGAAVAGGVGAISAAGAKGKQINVPSETRLAFKLKAPLPLN